MLLAYAIFSLQSAAFGEDQEIRLAKTGGLTDVLNAMIVDHVKTRPVRMRITTIWRTSGVLREELERGEAFDIFASAASPEAQNLSDAAISGPSELFVRNSLGATVPMPSNVTSDTLADFQLKPETRLATSTTQSSPGGDYT